MCGLRCQTSVSRLARRRCLVQCSDPHSLTSAVRCTASSSLTNPGFRLGESVTLSSPIPAAFIKVVSARLSILCTISTPSSLRWIGAPDWDRCLTIPQPSLVCWANSNYHTSTHRCTWRRQLVPATCKHGEEPAQPPDTARTATDQTQHATARTATDPTKHATACSHQTPRTATDRTQHAKPPIRHSTHSHQTLTRGTQLRPAAQQNQI